MVLNSKSLLDYKYSSYNTKNAITIKGKNQTRHTEKSELPVQHFISYVLAADSSWLASAINCQWTLLNNPQYIWT